MHVHVSAKAAARHTPSIKAGGRQRRRGAADVWPGSWELLCTFVSL